MHHSAVSIFVCKQDNLQRKSLKHSEMLQTKCTYVSKNVYVQENCGVCACIYGCHAVCVYVCVCEDLVLCIGCEHPGSILDMMMVYWVPNPWGNLIHLVVSSHPSRPQRTLSSEQLAQWNWTYWKYHNVRKNLANVLANQKKEDLVNTMMQHDKI